jgi:hypothetical protein
MDPPSNPSSPSDTSEVTLPGLEAVRRRVFRGYRMSSVVVTGGNDGGESGYAEACERDDEEVSSSSSVGVLGDGDGLNERFLLRS